MSNGGKKRRRAPMLLLCAAALLALSGLLLWLGYRPLLRLSYPRQYEDFVRQASQTFAVEETMIYAVIRTESSFDPDAVSYVGATGLMQLTDDTFAWAVSRQEAPFPRGEVIDPQTNIFYGTLVLRHQFEVFGNWDTALAAYNAGGGTVRKWLDDPRYSADGETLLHIPYPETENFVQRVNDAREMYRTLYDFS